MGYLVIMLFVVCVSSFFIFSYNWLFFKPPEEETKIDENLIEIIGEQRTEMEE